MWPDFLHDCARAIWIILWFGVTVVAVITAIAALGPDPEPLRRLRCDLAARFPGDRAPDAGCVPPAAPAAPPIGG